MLCGLGASLFLFAGCSQKAPDAVVATPQETVPALETAFNGAPAEMKRQALEAVGELQTQNDPAAFVRLESLSRRPELTAEQRKAAVASWMAVNQRLRESAANGNSAAQQLLEKYRASK
jgi:hypothetical protein